MEKTLNQYKLTIVRLVEVNQGLKHSDLAIRFMSNTSPNTFIKLMFDRAISELVEERQLLTVTWDLNGYQNHFYLPPTRIEIK